MEWRKHGWHHVCKCIWNIQQQQPEGDMENARLSEYPNICASTDAQIRVVSVQSTVCCLFRAFRGSGQTTTQRRVSDRRWNSQVLQIRHANARVSHFTRYYNMPAGNFVCVRCTLHIHRRHFHSMYCVLYIHIILLHSSDVVKWRAVKAAERR